MIDDVVILDDNAHSTALKLLKLYKVILTDKHDDTHMIARAIGSAMLKEFFIGQGSMTDATHKVISEFDITADVKEHIYFYDYLSDSICKEA